MGELLSGNTAVMIKRDGSVGACAGLHRLGRHTRRLVQQRPT